MPRPATPHAPTTTATGAEAARPASSPAMPIATTANPNATSRGDEVVRVARAAIHDPAVQQRAAAVRGRPAKLTDRCFTAVIASETNASVPKNANVSAPLVTTAAGRPRLAR